VIVVDDHPSLLLALVRILERFCDVVASVSTGHDAINEVARLRPDILVADLMMPDPDGLEVCRRVKEQTPETAVVLVTAFDDPYTRTVAMGEARQRSFRNTRRPRCWSGPFSKSLRKPSHARHEM